MTIEQFNAIIVALVSGGTAAVVASLFAGKKTRAETRKIDAEAAEKFQKLATDMLDRYNELNEKYDLLVAREQKKDETISLLTRENATLKESVDRLTRRVRELEKQLPTT